jgi:hypothetical protein
VALAALEPYFWERLLEELWVDGDKCRDLERIFKTETAEDWATARDLPLAAVRDIEWDEENEEDENALMPKRRHTSTKGGDES